MAKKKEKFSFASVKILIFILIGGAMGAAISLFAYGAMFDSYLKMMKTYIENDWEKSLYYANRSVDQAIKLNKMLAADRVKYDREIFSKVTDTRARIIGADRVEDKVPLLEELEKDMNEILRFYNERMDLRNMRFGYIEWGMITAEYLEEYNSTKNRFRDTVKEYNDRIKQFPISQAAKSKGYGKVPLAGESTLHEIDLETEKYRKEDALIKYPMKK